MQSDDYFLLLYWNKYANNLLLYSVKLDIIYCKYSEPLSCDFANVRGVILNSYNKELGDTHKCILIKLALSGSV